MSRAWAPVLATSLLLVLLVRQPAPTEAGVMHSCGQGFVHGVVRGRHVCTPAADVRVALAASPPATRVGGATTYTVTVANRGRRRAERVTLRLAGPGESVSASATRGTCRPATGSLRAQCTIGSLAPGAGVVATVVVRATAEGPSSLAARATSATRESSSRNNVAVATTRVTPPDSVRGRGTRPVFGGVAAGEVIVEVDAIGAPLGGEPAGVFATTYARSIEFAGRVVCLTVSGNRASVGGIVERSTDESFAPVGSAVLLAFTDGGPGADTQITYPRQSDARRCPVPLFASQPEVALDGGDFVITDVRP